MSQPVTHLYGFVRFRLDAIKRLLLRNGEGLPIKSKNFDLLLALANTRPGAVRSDARLEHGRARQRRVSIG